MVFPLYAIREQATHYKHSWPPNRSVLHVVPYGDKSQFYGLAIGKDFEKTKCSWLRGMAGGWVTKIPHKMIQASRLTEIQSMYVRQKFK